MLSVITFTCVIGRTNVPNFTNLLPLLKAEVKWGDSLVSRKGL